MTSADSYDRLASVICSLGKSELIRKIRDFRGRIKLDFTESYLQELSADRLRHILWSAITTVGGGR